MAAIWILDVEIYITNRWWHVGYHATNVVFSLMPFVYAWLAVRRN